MKERVRFRDLSPWLKVAVIMAFVSGGTWILAFTIGFIEGLLGVMP
jgi:hypothetical protein